MDDKCNTSAIQEDAPAQVGLRGGEPRIGEPWHMQQYHFQRTYTVRETHNLTGIPVSTLNRMVRDGRLMAMVPGGYQRGRRIPAAEIARILSPTRAGSDCQDGSAGTWTDCGEVLG